MCVLETRTTLAYEIINMVLSFSSTVHDFHLLEFFFFFGWQAVLDGKYDDLSEQSFYMVGGIEEVIAKAEKIAKESAA